MNVVVSPSLLHPTRGTADGTSELTYLSKLNSKNNNTVIIIVITILRNEWYNKHLLHAPCTRPRTHVILGEMSHGIIIIVYSLTHANDEPECRAVEDYIPKSVILLTAFI